MTEDKYAIKVIGAPAISAALATGNAPVCVATAIERFHEQEQERIKEQFRRREWARAYIDTDHASNGGHGITTKIRELRRGMMLDRLQNGPPPPPEILTRQLRRWLERKAERKPKAERRANR